MSDLTSVEYCDAIIATKKEKMSGGRCGKTFRRSPYFSYDQEKEVILERSLRSNQGSSEGVKEWPVTEIDNLFDLGFCCGSTGYYGSSSKSYL